MAPEVPVDVFTGTGKVSTLNAGYSKRAYVTFLAGNGDYVKGVVGLAKGLRKLKSAYPLVVAMLPDVPEEHREILRSQGCIVREIEPIYPPQNHTQFAMAYYVINYSKLRIWDVSTLIYIYIYMDRCRTRTYVRTCCCTFRCGVLCFTLYLQFEEYSKMMYLDADIQVFENIDHLFDTPDGYFYAVMDCFCEKTWSHTPPYKIGYCQQFPEKVTWPVDQMGSPPPPLYFNAGMFVFEPNRLTYENLHEVLKSLHLRCLQSK